MDTPDYDPLEAPSAEEAVAVSGWTGEAVLAIGNEQKEEWVKFDGPTEEVKR